MRWALAWVLYAIGDLFSDVHYGVYNWCMVTSEKIQGKGNGPWE
jgi:hypothetical protein